MKGSGSSSIFSECVKRCLSGNGTVPADPKCRLITTGSRLLHPFCSTQSVHHGGGGGLFSKYNQIYSDQSGEVEFHYVGPPWNKSQPTPDRIRTGIVRHGGLKQVMLQPSRPFQPQPIISIYCWRTSQAISTFRSCMISPMELIAEEILSHIREATEFPRPKKNRIWSINGNDAVIWYRTGSGNTVWFPVSNPE